MSPFGNFVAFVHLCHYQLFSTTLARLRIETQKQDYNPKTKVVIFKLNQLHGMGFLPKSMSKLGYFLTMS
jgi:hypothetical protein